MCNENNLNLLERYFVDQSFVKELYKQSDEISFFDYSLLDQFGFLNHSNYNPAIKTISEVLNEKFACIVAESGMGKTYISEFLERSLPNNVSLIKLCDYNDSADIFEKALNNQIKLNTTIIFDGLDEATNLTKSIKRKVKELRNNDNISLIITSRPTSYIFDISDKCNLKKFNLLPLSQQYILKDLDNKRINKNFLKLVKELNLGSLCAKPIGYNILLKQYTENNLENQSYYKIMELSIKYLCSETENKQSEDKTILQPNEAYEYAKIIAITSKLSDKSFIKYSYESLCLDNKYITNDNFISIFNFDIQKIEKLLQRTLFVSTDKNTYKFSHALYQDFLCTEYIRNHIKNNDSYKKVWKPIFFNNDVNLVYPKWEYVVSLLSISNEDIKKDLIENQPELLLNADIDVNSIGCLTIFNAIMKRINNLDYQSINNISFIRPLFKLYSEETINAISEVLTNNDSTINEKATTLNIIKSCAGKKPIDKNIQKSIIKIFIDSKENKGIREKAGYSLINNISDDLINKCLPLLSEENIPGYLLIPLFRFSYTNTLSLQDIFSFIIKKKLVNDSSIWLWLKVYIPMILNSLEEDKIIELINYYLSKGNKHLLYESKFLIILQQTITMWWNKYFSETKLNFIANTFISLQENNISMFYEDKEDYVPKTLSYSWENSKLKSQLLAVYLIDENLIDENNIYYLDRILLEFDIDFTINQINKNNSNKACIWANYLFRHKYKFHFPEDDSLWNYLHEKFPNIFDKDANRECNERFLLEKEHKKNELSLKIDKTIRFDSKIEFLNKINKDIDNSNFKTLKLYSILIKELNIEIISDKNKNIWDHLTKNQQKTIISKTHSYLFSNDIKVLDNRIIIDMFLFLYYYNKETLIKLPKIIWDNVFKLLLLYIFDSRFRYLLIPIIEIGAKKYYDIFENNLLEVFSNKLEKEIILEIKLFDYINEHTYIKILNLLEKYLTKDIIIFEVLSNLLELHSKLVKKFCLKNLLNNNYWLERNMYLCSIIIMELFPEKTSDYFSYAENNKDWAKNYFITIVEKIGYDYNYGRFLGLFNINEYLKLYLLFDSLYPYENSPQHGGVYNPDITDKLYTFKCQIFNYTSCFNNKERIDFLYKLYKSDSKFDWAYDYYLRAKKAEFTLETPNYSIDEIQKIVNYKSKTCILNTNADLIEYIMNLLHDYQKYLTGKLYPRVKDLWNEIKKTTKHKNEQHFSDHLASYLRLRFANDSIFINREVQLNPGIQGEKGARCDLWINAISNNQEDKISLCVEVKGDWNSEWKTSFKNQLVNKYINDGGASCGIFLVGLFNKSNKIEKFNNVLETQKIHIQEKYNLKNLIDFIVIDCRIEKP